MRHIIKSTVSVTLLFHTSNVQFALLLEKEKREKRKTKVVHTFSVCLLAALKKCLLCPYK
jgi:hypothetical protein